MTRESACPMTDRNPAKKRDHEVHKPIRPGDLLYPDVPTLGIEI
jgi:hypothetical protein